MTRPKQHTVRNALLAGISAFTATSAMDTAAVAAEATNIYGIYGDAILSSGDGGTAFVLEADKSLTIKDSTVYHGINSDTTGMANTDHYSKVWLDGATTWINGTAGANNLSTPVADTDSILTKTDNTGTVIFSNYGGVDRSIGSSNKALKQVLVKGEASAFGAQNIWTHAFNIDAKGTFAIAGLASSNGGSTDVTFSDSGALLISAMDPYVRMSAKTLHGGTDGLGKITVRAQSSSDIVFNGIGDSTNYLAQVGLGGRTSATSNGSIYSANTIIDTTETTSARLTGNGSNLTLGQLVYFIDYNAANEKVQIGNVTNLGGTINLKGLTISADGSTGIDNGLTTLWDRRAENDDAVNLGKILQYGTLQVNGQNVGFSGQKYVGSGTTYTAASALPVQKYKLAAWNFALAEQGNTVTSPGEAYLLLVRDASGFTDASSGSGLDGGSFGGIAGAMNKIAGNGTALSNFLDGLSAADVPVAVQQMTNNAVNNQISNTIGSVSGAANDAISSNIGGNGTGATTAQRTLASGINAGDVSKRNNAWVQVIGSWNRQDRRNNVDGYTADTYGFAFGGDTLLSEATRLGIALHYANTRVDGLGVYQNNNSRINTYGVTLYGQQNLTDHLFVDGRLGYAYNDVSSDRYISGLNGKAKASYGAHQIHASTRVGYDAAIGKNTTLTPHLGLSYSYLSENSYTESGNIAALHVGSRNTNALTVGGGLQGKIEFTTQDQTKIIPELRAGVYYDTLASSLDTTARFVDGGVSFITRNIKPDPWTVHLGAGVNVVTTGNVTLTANYDAALRDRYAGHTGSLRAKMAF